MNGFGPNCVNFDSMVRRCLTPIFLVALLPFLLSAQPVGDWNAVRQFTAGQPVRIGLVNGKTVQGKFQSATDSEVLVATSQAQQTVARADVTKIATKGKNHRLRNALIGLGAGAGGGLAAGAIVDHGDRCTPPGGCLLNFSNLGKVVLTPAGAVVGLIIGAVIPSGNWRDVYRTK